MLLRRVLKEAEWSSDERRLSSLAAEAQLASMAVSLIRQGPVTGPVPILYHGHMLMRMVVHMDMMMRISLIRCGPLAAFALPSSCNIRQPRRSHTDRTMVSSRQAQTARGM